MKFYKEAMNSGIPEGRKSFFPMGIGFSCRQETRLPARFSVDGRANCANMSFMQKKITKQWQKPKLKESPICCECTAYAGAVAK